MGCGFIHLNTPAASQSWAGDKESDLKVPAPSCVPISDVVRNKEASSFLIASTPGWFITSLSSFLHTAFLCKSRVSPVIQLNPHIRLAKTPCAFWFSNTLWAPVLLEAIFRFYFCVMCCCTSNQRLWQTIIARCTIMAMFLFLIPGIRHEHLLSLACEEMQRH